MALNFAVGTAGEAVNEWFMQGSLQIFQIVVDGSDPRWQEIDPRSYNFFNPGGFNFRDMTRRQPGKWLVDYALVPHDNVDPVTGQPLNDNGERVFRRPDRAITETILDARGSELTGGPITGVIANTAVYAVGICQVGVNRRLFCSMRLGQAEYDKHRFIAVVNETRL